MIVSVGRADHPLLFFLCLNDRGGAEISMMKVACQLAARGRSVVCVVYGSQPMLARTLGFEGEVIDLGVTRTWATLWPLFRLLHRRRFSIIIAALTHTNMAACLVANTPVIATEHGIDGIDQCYRSPLWKYLVRSLYARAHAVVTVSHGLAQRWQVFLSPDARVTTIYNPLVSDEKETTPLPPHPWLMDRTIPVILGIGRLKAEKNFSFLLRGFAQANHRRPLRLIILGEGEQRPVLEKRIHELTIEDRVIMPGFVDHPHAWLAHASLLVCPSEKEGFGNVIVEALAWGVPIISSDCPCGPSEILDKGNYGRLVPINDVDALAQAMAEALDSSVDQQKLQARARDFTVARCIDGYAALIDNLLTIQK